MKVKKADAGREPDKGEFTKFNKTAFVFVTCKIQKADSMCLYSGRILDTAQPVWSLRHSPRTLLWLTPGEIG